MEIVEQGVHPGGPPIIPEPETQIGLESDGLAVVHFIGETFCETYRKSYLIKDLFFR